MPPSEAVNDIPGTLHELNVESRLLLTFLADEAVVQRLLPAGWQVNPAAQGPAKDANLILVVADRLTVQDAGGTPLPGQSPNQLAVLAVPARSGIAAGLVIAYGLSGQSAGAPGPYQVFAPAEAKMDRHIRVGPGALCEEDWSFAAADGARIAVRAAYRRGTPMRSASETRAYSAADPSFCRIYVADQGADPLQLGGTPGDRLELIDVAAEGSRLAFLGDGSARLLSVVSIPWTVRRAFIANPL